MTRDVVSSAVRRLVLVGGLLRIVTGDAYADPPIVATFDMNEEGGTLTAELRFDLAGGPVAGSATLNVGSNRDDPPERQDGGLAPGRFRVTADLKGHYDGGRFAPLAGSATLTGTFTDESGCEAKLRGDGKLSGNVSAPLGMVEVTLEWPDVEFDGCALASPQPFAAKLPLLNFSPVEEAPTQRGASGAVPDGARVVDAPASSTGGATTAAVAAPPSGADSNPPVVVPPVGAGTAPENDPTYMPKDEAIEHRRKADEAEGKGDIETAIKENQEALRIEPRYAPWWSVLGEMLAEHGRWPEAEKAFARAVELNPNEPEYRACLAEAMLKQGRKEEAIKHAGAALVLAHEQKNEMTASHPVYGELGIKMEAPPPAAVTPARADPAPGSVPKQQKSYRGLKFSVTGVKRAKEHEGAQAEPGQEIVVVGTVIDRSEFEADARGNECRLDRAKLYDAAGEMYASTEQQRRVTVPLRNEDGTLAGGQELSYDWSFVVPEGTHVKTFKFVFGDEHVFTGGQDPDENVTDLSFDLE